MKNKNLLILVAILLVLTIGTTFAYFLVQTNATGTGGSVTSNTAKTLKITYDAKDRVTKPLAKPGDKLTKDISVTIEPGTDFNEATYGIYLNITKNTFKKCNEETYNDQNNICAQNAQELTYILKDQNGKEIGKGDLTGKESGKVTLAIETKTVDKTTTYTYTLEIEYKETNQDQNHNANAEFNGDVDVQLTEKPLTAATLIANHVCTVSSDVITEEDAQNCLVDENGYRFEGPDPNNYVRFNNEQWRIIGVFNVETEDGPEQLIKIIRTKSEAKAWDETYSKDWERPATLNNYLNNTYLNTISEIDKIASVKWNIGPSTSYKSTETVYTDETRIKTTNNYKVGLMSLSDYGYATLNNTCYRTKTIDNYNNTGCSDKDWIYDSNETWTLTPNEGSSNVHYVNKGGQAPYNIANPGFNTRPTVYLKSYVSLTVGSGLGDPGSSTNPYIVN